MKEETVLPPILKNQESCTPEYIAALREWIIEQKNAYFDHKGFRAKSFCDFNDFNHSRAFTRHSLCMPDEVMLIDRRWQGEHWYVICKISKKRKCKDLFPVVKVSDLEPNSWRNGYFLLPYLPLTSHANNG